MAQAEVVSQLVHEGPALLVRGPHVVAAYRDLPEAPERDHEVVAQDLGAARGGAAGLVVHEEGVVVRVALGAEPLGRVGSGPFGCGSEPRGLERVVVRVTGSGQRRTGDEGRIRGVERGAGHCPVGRELIVDLDV